MEEFNRTTPFSISTTGLSKKIKLPRKKKKAFKNKFCPDGWYKMEIVL